MRTIIRWLLRRNKWCALSGKLLINASSANARNKPGTCVNIYLVKLTALKKMCIALVFLQVHFFVARFSKLTVGCENCIWSSYQYSSCSTFELFSKRLPNMQLTTIQINLDCWCWKLCLTGNYSLLLQCLVVMRCGAFSSDECKEHVSIAFLSFKQPLLFDCYTIYFYATKKGCYKHIEPKG